MKLLVFPTDCSIDHELYAFLTKAGVSVIGASSSKGQIFWGQETEYLPYITDEGFSETLQQLIEAKGISHIYTAHAGVWGLLEWYISDKTITADVSVCSEFPFDLEWKKFAHHANWGMAAKSRLENSAAGGLLREDELIALCKNYNDIPGQSDNLKLESLINITPAVPEGDWVEIGCLYGRSSFALGFLAKRFCGSNLVCVDPWDAEKIPDQQGKAEILDQQGKQINYEQIFQIFRSSIGLLENVTYIQGLSEEAIARYLMSDLDGPGLSLTHSIAFLHIDGSHHFDEVTKDIALWEPHVCVGGWIAVDDYLWAFGDGPKKAGDNLLRTGRFDEAFVSGDTLYMRKAF